MLLIPSIKENNHNTIKFPDIIQFLQKYVPKYERVRKMEQNLKLVIRKNVINEKVAWDDLEMKPFYQEILKYARFTQN